jgi:hypothetical protein
MEHVCNITSKSHNEFTKQGPQLDKVTVNILSHSNVIEIAHNLLEMERVANMRNYI